VVGAQQRPATAFSPGEAVVGFGIDIGEATADDEAEQAALVLNLKAWKTYKFALGKVTVQPTWYAAPVWPAEPPTPVIVAAPEEFGAV
jgi:hypothetical protein